MHKNYGMMETNETPALCCNEISNGPDCSSENMHKTVIVVEAITYFVKCNILMPFNRYNFSRPIFCENETV